MELVPGKTLAQAILRGPAARHGDALRPPGGRGPGPRTRAGVIHRDLKTANIVINAERRSEGPRFRAGQRIQTKELDELTHSRLDVSLPGTLVGTLPYMAPEVLRGDPATERSDLWALGVLLFEMAAGCQALRREDRDRGLVCDSAPAGSTAARALAARVARGDCTLPRERPGATMRRRGRRW